jgi:hypothetical protein
MTRASNKGFGVVLCDRLRADQPRRSTARTRCGRRAVPGDPDRRRRHPPLSGVPARRPPLPAFEAGDPAELIEARVAPGRTALAPFQYEVTADGKRFLMVTSGGETAESPVTVVLNWQKAVAGGQ